MYKLGKGEGIWNRGTESGTRWQTSGSFAIDKEGMVRWVEVARSADEIADFEEALVALGVKVRKKKEEPMPAILGHL